MIIPPSMENRMRKILKGLLFSIVLLCLLLIFTIAGAKSIKGDYKDPFTGIKFVYVKGDCYEMGDSYGDGESDERPVHRVCLNDFYMGIYEVTQGQWERLMGNNPSHFKKGGDYPVDNVSWYHVQAFIERLNQKTGKAYRLPTEAEWEYAARSRGRRDKWSGTSSESELEIYAWYGKNSGESSHPVGEKRPNKLGLYDMSGNVWEWCSDYYREDYYSQSQRDNPTGPDRGEFRVLRGGSFLFKSSFARTSFRAGFTPSSPHNHFFGFRLVLPVGGLLL